jgi:hypothetical protein
LRQSHQILLPNSRFRNTRIEILSNNGAKGLIDWVDFNLGYGLESTRVESFLYQVWENARKRQNAIGSTKPRVSLVNNGDHAVTWRLYYTTVNVYKVLSAKWAINRAAYDLSLEQGIGLNTPLTHELLSPDPEPAPNPIDSEDVALEDEG